MAHFKDYDVADFRDAAVSAPAEERARFIVKTYAHLFAAIVGFTGLEFLLFTTPLGQNIRDALMGVNWLIVLGGFMVVSWFASKVAMQATSKLAQYAALAAFVGIWAVIFLPLLGHAAQFEGVISSAAIVTLLGFAGLTIIAFVSRRDFSFLGTIIKWGMLMALVTIVAAVIFGLHLGVFFSCIMVALAGGSILFETSNIIRHYPTDRHVAASLGLFSSVALLFWYVLQIFLSFSND